MRVHVLLLSILVIGLRPADQAAFGQRTNAGIDQPTQRWIPIPQGSQTGLSKQAELLQQLRDFVVDEPSSQSLPTLSDEQLQEMEKAFDQWRDKFGDDQLPDLSSIPKDWIEAAVPDPQERKQAEELLRRYARERNLPLPSSGEPMSQDGVRIPNDRARNSLNPSSDNPPQTPRAPSLDGTTPRSDSPNANSANSSAQSQAARNGTPPNANSQRPIPPSAESASPGASSPRTSSRESSDLNRQSPNAEFLPPPASGQPARRPLESVPRGNSAQDSNLPPPEQLDPQRIKALKELLSQLSRETSSRQSANAQSQSNMTPPQNNMAPPSLGSQGNRSLSASPPQTRNSFPAGSRQGSTQRSAPGISQLSESQGFRPSGESPVPAEDALAAGSGRLSSAVPQQSGRASVGSPMKEGPSVAATDGPSPGKRNVSQPGRQANANGTQPNANSQTPQAPQPDLKEQVERFGLGATLRGIVDKTLKEQGADKNPSQIIKSIQKIANVDLRPSKSTTATKRQSPTVAPNTSAATPVFTPSRPATIPRPRRTNSGERSSESGSGNTSELLADFWRAISTTPAAGSAAAEAVGKSADTGGGMNFRVGVREWSVLAIALLVCVILLAIARKRSGLSAEAAVRQRESVKEILRTGIRSRADVVAAFHRFALQRPHSAASWWTHSYVARKFQESSPHIGRAIEDLARVYEQARYLPSDVELSSEQLDRAEAAFQQCVTVEA